MDMDITDTSGIMVTAGNGLPAGTADALVSASAVNGILAAATRRTWMRARRMLAKGDLRLIALALIAEAPLHGYEIIKLLEEKTADWYSPSPGIIYPTLTYLEEAGYVTASAEGAKKLYTITEEGSAYLKANREIVDAVLDRLSALGERVNRWRHGSAVSAASEALCRR
jgi:DNA-binding PadR family transcriptional regulator